MTHDYFEDTDSWGDNDVTDMSTLDRSSDEEQKEQREPDDDISAVTAADSASVIATPAHERAVITPGDHVFIKDSDESDTPVSNGHVNHQDR